MKLWVKLKETLLYVCIFCFRLECWRWKVVWLCQLVKNCMCHILIHSKIQGKRRKEKSNSMYVFMYVDNHWSISDIFLSITSTHCMLLQNCKKINFKSQVVIGDLRDWWNETCSGPCMHSWLVIYHLAGSKLLRLRETLLMLITKHT